MSTRESRDKQVSNHLQSLTDDLEERIRDLKHFDAASEVNSHCDDLVGQIMLTIESAMEHLNKVQTRMVSEVNEYRNELLDAAGSTKSGKKHSHVQENFKKLSQEFEAFKSKTSTKSLSSEASKTANELKERASELRKQMRFKAFDGRFIRLVENDFLEGDIIGSLVENQRDVQDDFVVKHTVLDAVPSPYLDVNLFPGTTDPDDTIEVTAVHFLREGQLAIGLDYRSSIVIWDLVANKKLFQLKSAESHSHATAFVQLPNGHLVSGDSNGSIQVWDLRAKKLVQTLECDGNGDVLWLKVLPNGHLAACSSKIYIWDLSKQQNSQQQHSKRLRNEPETQFGLNLYNLYTDYYDWDDETPRGSYLSKSCEVDVEDWSEELNHSYSEDECRIMVLEFHFELLSSGQLALSCLTPDEAQITIWNPDSGRVHKRVKVKGNDIESCTILPTGNAVICRTNNQVELYGLQDEKMFHSFCNNKGPIVAIRNQPRSSLLQFVHLKDPRLPILAKENLRSLGYNDSDDFVSSTCFSDDGRHFAVGGDRAKLLIWPLQDN